MWRNSRYFAGSEERIQNARQHLESLSMYKDDISKSISGSVCYGNPFNEVPSTYTSMCDCSNIRKKYNTNIVVCDSDSVSAVFNYIRHGADIAVLNFASFKNPGGKFLEGSKAQEECLCHESTLYPVLKEFEQSYYSVNRRNTNRALYFDRAIFSPDIIFMRDNAQCKCSVITCAAPNYYAAKEYYGVSAAENLDALFSRIQFVLSVAECQGIEDMILGAFGCGVFGQDANIVAKLFDYLLRTDFKGIFENIIFAIPNSRDGNYNVFRNVFY